MREGGGGGEGGAGGEGGECGECGEGDALMRTTYRLGTIKCLRGTAMTSRLTATKTPTMTLIFDGCYKGFVVIGLNRMHGRRGARRRG